MPNTLNLDFETYSEVDIKKVGAYHYARHPSTEVLMASYKINDGETYLWDNTKEPITFDLAGALATPSYRIHAYNAQFERLILKYVLNQNIEIERFRCTMIHAFSLGFGGDLATVAKAVGLPSDKQKLKTGRKLIQRFSKPAPKNHKADRYTRFTHPNEWESFCEYGIRDTDTEHGVLQYLNQYPIRMEDLRDWWLDQKINDRGVPIDLELIRAAIDLNNRHRTQLLNEMSELTGLDNPNSREQLLAWLRDQLCERDVPDLTAATVEFLVHARSEHELVHEVLLRKQQIAQSSIAKYEAAARSHVNGRVYGMTQFMGAPRTGRYAGRILQLQNFARPKIKSHIAAENILNEFKQASGH